MSNSSDFSEADTSETESLYDNDILYISVTESEAETETKSESVISDHIADFENPLTQPPHYDKVTISKEQKWFDKPQMFKLLRNIENYIIAKKDKFVSAAFPTRDTPMLEERYSYIKRTLEAHYPIILPVTWCIRRHKSTVRMTGEIKWRIWTLKELSVLKLRGVLPMVRYPQTSIEESVLNRALEYGPYVPNHQHDKASFLWLRSYYDGRLMTTALHTSTSE